MGTQDTLAEAREFVETYQIRSVDMLWDASFESWRALGISGQPAALLLGADGTQLGSWFGPFDEAEVLELIATA